MIACREAEKAWDYVVLHDSSTLPGELHGLCRDYIRGCRNLADKAVFSDTVKQIAKAMGRSGLIVEMDSILALTAPRVPANAAMSHLWEYAAVAASMCGCRRWSTSYWMPWSRDNYPRYPWWVGAVLVAERARNIVSPPSSHARDRLKPYLPPAPWMIRREWKSPPAVGLAKTIYDDEKWDLYPVLADALEEAGCTFAYVLREESETYSCRGNWILDWLLNLDGGWKFLEE